MAGADGPDVLGELLLRLSAKGGDTLASLTPYQAVTKRLTEAAGDLVPDVRWYIDPLAVAEFAPRGTTSASRTSRCCATRALAHCKGSADS